MTNLTRRNFILGSLGVASLFTTGSLSGCSGSVAWYQLDKFLAQDPSAIVKELEENQGLEYQGEQDLGTYLSYDVYVWGGIPKDPLTKSGENEILELFKGDHDALSRDELLDGEEITGATITFDTDAFDNGSIESTVEDIVKKCGFSNKKAEGMHDNGFTYIAAGSCQIDGQDGYWRIDIFNFGSGQVSVFKGNTEMLDNIENNIEQ